jgi:hypothetical protein
MAMKTIIVTSGEFKGRYVGVSFSGKGLVTNPEVRSNPPVNLTGTKYGLWLQEDVATQFFEQNVAAVLADLKAAGVEAEAVDS